MEKNPLRTSLLGLSAILAGTILNSFPAIAQNTNQKENSAGESNSGSIKGEQEVDPSSSNEAENIVYNPPQSTEDRGKALKRRTGSGIRNRCTAENLPQTLIAPQSHIGLTTQSHPQLSIYFAEIPKLPVSINLEDPQQMKELWLEEVKVDRPGIYTFRIPEAVPPLVPGKEYDWTVALICNRQKRRRDIFARAAIMRVAMPIQVKRELSFAQSPIAKAQILARAGLFYDAFAKLSTSNNRTAKNLLSSLLNQVDLVNLSFNQSENHTATERESL